MKKSRRQQVRKFCLLASFILYPITYFILSPDLLLFGAAEGVLAGDVIFFGGLFLFSMFGGRLFCGWICPAGALQELTFAINDKPANNRWNWLKFLSFIPWISIFAFLVIYAGGFRTVNFFYKRAFGIDLPASAEWIMYLMTVAIIFGLALIIGKRALCHYLCWVSPFMILGESLSKFLHLPSLKLITTPESRTSCGACLRACPMSLPVKDLVQNGVIRHLECLLCGSCADSCPEGVIKFTFSSKSQK